MKVLQLISYYSPERVASSHLTEDREAAFAAADIELEIYVPTPTRGVSKEERDRYKQIKKEMKYDGKIVVHRFAMYREGKNPLLRALRYFLVNIVQYFKGVGARKIDAILCGSTPPTQGALCGLIKRRMSKRACKKIPFVYILQDIFPDSLVNAKMTREGSVIWKIGRKIEDFTYRSADKIIVISEDFKRNIMAKGVPEDKIVIIPNWVDTDQVYPIDRKDNLLVDRYNLDRDKFYVCYSGNVGHSQNLQLLIDTAKVLQTDMPDVCFVIIGEGAAKEELAQMIAKENLSNVVLLPFQDYADIAHVFSLGDAGLIISKPGIGGSSVPSKTWSIMAAGRPVLASFDGDSSLAKLVADTGCGLNAQAGDLNALICAVRQLYGDRQKAVDMGTIGRNYIVDNLSKEKCTGMYVSTLKAAVSGGKEHE